MMRAAPDCAQPTIGDEADIHRSEVYPGRLQSTHFQNNLHPLSMGIQVPAYLSKETTFITPTSMIARNSNCIAAPIGSQCKPSNAAYSIPIQKTNAELLSDNVMLSQHILLLDRKMAEQAHEARLNKSQIVAQCQEIVDLRHTVERLQAMGKSSNMEYLHLQEEYKLLQSEMQTAMSSYLNTIRKLKRQNRELKTQNIAVEAELFVADMIHNESTLDSEKLKPSLVDLCKTRPALKLKNSTPDLDLVCNDTSERLQQTVHESQSSLPLLSKAMLDYSIGNETTLWSDTPAIPVNEQQDVTIDADLTLEESANMSKRVSNNCTQETIEISTTDQNSLCISGCTLCTPILPLLDYSSQESRVSKNNLLGVNLKSSAFSCQLNDICSRLRNKTRNLYTAEQANSKNKFFSKFLQDLDVYLNYLVRLVEKSPTERKCKNFYYADSITDTVNLNGNQQQNTEHLCKSDLQDEANPDHCSPDSVCRDPLDKNVSKPLGVDARRSSQDESREALWNLSSYFDNCTKTDDVASTTDQPKHISVVPKLHRTHSDTYISTDSKSVNTAQREAVQGECALIREKQDLGKQPCGIKSPTISAHGSSTRNSSPNRYLSVPPIRTECSLQSSNQSALAADRSCHSAPLVAGDTSFHEDIEWLELLYNRLNGFRKNE
ncbi:hypothetical protein BDV3_000545 [Batrachochytrium dendrobatidis]|uniref:Uncharacterized protein n=1 Tax=Batrachochytrium dendrobatidis (strain JEL423) TaxID=403673 RepID=A0A177WDW4_BATDL|nr:hypothetical protein BDEG_21578 [Batrachochytrium dendrobatidis JEL423]